MLPLAILAVRELKFRTLPVAATRSVRLDLPHTLRVFAPKIIAEFA
jgi:hypothetical protein